MQLGSRVAVTVVYAGSCSSDSTPSLGTSTCHGVALKRQIRARAHTHTHTHTHKMEVGIDVLEYSRFTFPEGRKGVSFIVLSPTSSRAHLGKGNVCLLNTAVGRYGKQSVRHISSGTGLYER